MELRNEKLTEEVLSLSKLNMSLTTYKNKINKQIDNSDINEDDKDDSASEETSKIKSRILTYSKDKLISIRVDQIAYINTENSITSIHCLDGKKYTNNSSLDELYNSLDHSIFFRANRQYILSVKGIDEILRYGNNQLKIKINPEKSVIISKNKASEFKKWLNM